MDGAAGTHDDGWGKVLSNQTNLTTTVSCRGKGSHSQGSIHGSGYAVLMEVRIRGYSRIQGIIGYVYR